MMKHFMRGRLNEGAGRRTGIFSGPAAAIVLAALLFAGAYPRGAQGGDHTHSWTGGGGDGVWENADNWEPEEAPDGAGHVVLISVTDHGITVPAGMTLGGLTLEGDYTGTVTLGGTLTVSDEGASGNLTVSAGTLRTHTSTDAAYSGSITVDGTFTIGSDGTVVVRRSYAPHPHGGHGGAGQIITAGVMIVDGTMHADSEGFDLKRGPGSFSVNGRSGGSHGGRAGNADSLAVPPSYGSVKEPVALGSGGDQTALYAGAGGGAIVIEVDGDLTVNGTIGADGGTVSNWSRGGSGGSINIRAYTLGGDGLIRASGGDAGDNGGGGGGGRIAARVDAGEGFGDVRFEAYGGSGDYVRAGAAGTVYLEHAGHEEDRGELRIDNGARPELSYTFTELSEYGDVLHEFASVIISGNGNLSVRDGDSLDFGEADIRGAGTADAFLTVSGADGVEFPAEFVLPDEYTLCIDVPVEAGGDWTIPDGAVLSHNRNFDAQARWLEIELDGSLTIDTGGKIDAGSKGYYRDQGPGAGPVANTHAASHGGKGAVRLGEVSSGPTYGSAVNPTTIGSGGRLTGYGLRGGGAVILSVSGALTVNGEVGADGKAPLGANRRGGSGGSVNIAAGQVTGSGTVSARGSNSTSNDGSGGGGRIAVRTSGADTGDVKLEASGGSATHGGAAGTIYLETGGDSPGAGRLIVNNTHTTPGGVVTELPASHAVLRYPDELQRVTLIIKNEGKVGLTDDITVGDLRLE